MTALAEKTETELSNYDKEMEVIRKKLAHSEEQADRGEYADYSLESFREEMRQERLNK